MTDEELNKMIGEFLPYPVDGQHYALKQFAKLVAAAEREACKQIVHDTYEGFGVTAKGIEYVKRRIIKQIEERRKK